MSKDNSDFTNGLLAFLGGAAAVLAVAGTMEEERQRPTRQRKPRTKKNKVISRTVTITQTSKFRECASCKHMNHMNSSYCRNCWSRIQ